MEKIAPHAKEPAKESIQELIEEVSALATEPVVASVLSPILDPQIIETTAQKVDRLLQIAGDPNQHLEGYQEKEIHLLAELVSSRALIWRNVASALNEQSKTTQQEAEKVQKVADTLTEVAARFAGR